MKTKLLFTKKQSNTLYTLLVFCLCFNYVGSQELVKNGTADDHGTGVPVEDTSNTSDNADAWDMTPNSTLNGGITSPYRYHADDNPDGWRNDDLETYLEDTYNSGGSVNEQPGSTSDGNYNDTEKTRGVKLYGETRRLYQKIVVEAGADYTFTLESRSSSAGTPSDVWMLNVDDLSTEVGLDDGVLDSRVDHYFEITTDENSSGGGVGDNTFTTTTFDFTASTTTVVIYVRSLNSTADNQVYFDNISLVKKVTASTNDVFASNFKIYPNPATDFISIQSKNIKITSVEMYNVIGKRLLISTKLNDGKLNISNLNSGVYLLKINANDRTLVKKVIIE